MRKILFIVLVIASVNTIAQEKKTPSRSCDANSTTEDCIGPKGYKQDICNTKECIQARQDRMDEHKEMRTSKSYRTGKYKAKKGEYEVKDKSWLPKYGIMEKNDCVDCELEDEREQIRQKKKTANQKTVECEHGQIDGQLVLICADGTYIKSSTAVDYSRKLEEAIERNVNKETGSSSGAIKN